MDTDHPARPIYESIGTPSRTRGVNISIQNVTRQTQSWYELGTRVPEVIRAIDVGGIRHLLLQRLRADVTARAEFDRGNDRDERILQCRQRTFRAKQNWKG